MENLTNWCVYMHENRINGKKYIGITSQKPTKRWQNGCGYRESPRFFKAIEKYGWDSFRHELLFTDLTKEEAERLEVELIAKYNTLDPDRGYNLDPGGGGTSSPTPEVRAKMSAARTGTHPTEETIERLRASHRGKVASIESRMRCSQSLKGVKKSPEHCRRIGETHSKPVQMLSSEGEIIQEFPSIKAASAAMGINFKNISATCHGHRAKAGGYKWRLKTG